MSSAYERRVFGVGDKRPVRKFYPETGDDFPIDELIYYEDDPAVVEPWNETEAWTDLFPPEDEDFVMGLPERRLPPSN